MIINKTQFPVGASFNSVTNLQNRFEQLQLQLATGKKYQTLSDLGSQRGFDLTVRNRLQRLEGYQTTLQPVQLRLDFYDQILSRLDELEGEARSTSQPNGYGTDGVNLTTAPNTAKSQMAELVSLLNSEINGRYLFGGSRTDARPVADISSILDGAGGRDGFRTIAGERKLADAGADGLGRLTIDQTGAVVTLAEDGAHPFGFKLSTLSSDSGNVALTAPSGSPATLGVEFTGQVTAGEKTRIGLTLPDGSELTLALTAVEGAPENPGEYTIGATEADTAANFAAALEAALGAAGEGELAGASMLAAADNFFNGRGEDVMRVDGPPFQSATALMVADPADTVIWYSGSDEPGSARQSVTARIADGIEVEYGAQANESGFVEMMRSLAAMAAENFPTNDASSKDRFDQIARAQQKRLAESNNGNPGSIEVITLEMGLALQRVGQTKERHTEYKNQLEGLLASIESAPIEEVAMEITAVQTRLQASYQTMSIVNQLSLVNFMR